MSYNILTLTCTIFFKTEVKIWLCSNSPPPVGSAAVPAPSLSSISEFGFLVQRSVKGGSDLHTHKVISFIEHSRA